MNRIRSRRIQKLGEISMGAVGKFSEEEYGEGWRKQEKRKIIRYCCRIVVEISIARLSTNLQFDFNGWSASKEASLLLAFLCARRVIRTSKSKFFRKDIPVGELTP